MGEAGLNKDSTRRTTRRRAKRVVVVAFGVLLVGYYFALPKRLFNEPYSTVLQSSDGQLMSAAIASDGQWRFPPEDSIPGKFADALIVFEDKRFRHHPGIDPFSIARAMRQNVATGKIVSGGSTITMQVIRLSRRGESRSFLEKMIEVILATRLELRYNKDEIMALYAAHAPFGGNVVGIEAACWRYFGSDPHDLTWGQAALLAVLPNAPAMIHPGKNRALLKRKRDRLIDKLVLRGYMDTFTATLAKAEPLPEAPLPLPRMAPHLLDRSIKDGFAERTIRSTLDFNLQQRVSDIVNYHRERQSGNQIFNAAAIVVEVGTGNVLSYVGNVESGGDHGDAVDIITAPRSTGSILKPFLYAAMMDEGKILPATILADIPTIINGFAPKNFSRQYDGAVPADQALIRSLNVPAVHLLRDFRHEKFHQLLGDIGMTTLTQAPDHYGLSLILGGAEGTLWDITGAYASMARTLNNYFDRPGKSRYEKGDFHELRYVGAAEGTNRKLEQTSWLSASSIYLTFETLKELYRPGEETGWRHFSSSRDIAWKTGTSFGMRDAWAVGVTPQYAVGVWIGNADGTGRPGLTGTDSAAPVLFDIFSSLPSGTWFAAPEMEMRKIATCRKSGHRASPRCPDSDTIWVTTAGLETPPCPYHKTVHLSDDRRFRLHSNCAPMNEMTRTNWFVLPPVQEYYYKSKNLTYHSLPPYRKDCEPSTSELAMDMIYPKSGAKIFIPRNLDGKPGSSVFHLAHRDPNNAVYWHLDGTYIGSTRTSHHLALAPEEGKHVLIVIDEQGEAIERHFEVISKM